MKKIMSLLLTGTLAICLMSCSKEVDDVSSKEFNQKKYVKKVFSLEVENFRKAINKIAQFEYLPTKEYTEKHGNQLSDERKQILLKPAKELIYSTGISEKELISETKGNINDILNKAFKIYITQTTLKK